VKLFSQTATLYTKVKKFLANKHQAESSEELVSDEIMMQARPQNQKLKKNIVVDITRGKLFPVFTSDMKTSIVS
jgi:hypothetical protein